METGGARGRPRGERRDHRVPAAAGKFGMTLFLIALGMLFAASMVGYLVIRIINLTPKIDPRTGEPIPTTAPALGTIDLPATLWLSTLIMLLSSVAIHSAVEAVRRERQLWLRRWLTVTLLLAAGFLLIQTPALGELLSNHFGAAQGFTAIFGLIAVLIIIHALHVVGGVVPLIAITYQAHQGRYDHEYFAPVSYLAMYWHFLDGVWLVMFAVLLIAS